EFCGPEAPFPPANMSTDWPGGVLVGMGVSGLVSWAANSTAPPCWPPLSALRLTMSTEGQSCVDACRSSDLVCEPAFFRFVNNKEALS
ncbi:alpha-1,6-mannosylglycoprotein 6-beta-N-acetylglucosaminyltransferase B-like, partial [Clarias magur]